MRCSASCASAGTARQAPVLLAYACRAVGTQLLAQRQVQPHVQEGIDLALLDGKRTGQRVQRFQQRVILRMQLDHGHDLRIQRLQRQVG